MAVWLGGFRISLIEAGVPTDYLSFCQLVEAGAWLYNQMPAYNSAESLCRHVMHRVWGHQAFAGLGQNLISLYTLLAAISGCSAVSNCTISQCPLISECLLV